MAWGQREKLENAKRTALGAEKMSLEVMKNLNEHTDKMKDIKVNIGNMNDEIDHSSSLLSRMMKMQNRNKKILLSFGIILFFIIVFGLILKFV